MIAYSMKVVRRALCVCGLVAAVPVLAHHSFAMFDDKQVTVTGTVKQLEWTNPHVWLWVVVDDGKGGAVTWGFEGAAPGEMARSGWTKRSVIPGDKITVQGRPLKDGRPGGSLGRVTREDGTPIGRSGPPAGGTGGPPPGGAPQPAK